MPTIDELTAENESLKEQVATLNLQVVEIRQTRSDIATAKDTISQLMATIVKMQQDQEAANAKAAEDLSQVQKTAALYEERWKTQNVYVITLENQAIGELKAALDAYRAAQLAAQAPAKIAELQAQIQSIQSMLPAQ